MSDNLDNPAALSLKGAASTVWPQSRGKARQRPNVADLQETNLQPDPSLSPTEAHAPIVEPTSATTTAPVKDVALRNSGSAIVSNGAGEMPSDKVVEHLWRFFALHAQQRISVFNFFIVLSGVLATAIGGGIQAGKPMAIVVIVLGCLLALISFVFFKLDQRGSDLIKLSEHGLRNAEAACLPAYARIFERETAVALGNVSQGETAFRTKWTFRTSFRLIFAVMGIYGLGAATFSAYRLSNDYNVKIEGAAEAGGTKTSGTTPADAASKTVSEPGTAQAHKSGPTSTFDPSHSGPKVTKQDAVSNDK